MRQSKWEYLVVTVGPTKAVDEMISYLKALPPVAEVSFAGERRGDWLDVICIAMKNDEEKFFMLAPPQGYVEHMRCAAVSTLPAPTASRSATQPATQGAATMPLKDDPSWIKARLEAGNCLVFSSSGSIMTLLGENKAAACLGAGVEVLKSDRTNDEKIILLQRCGILAPGKPAKVPEIVANFKPSKQLDERIDQAVKETGVAPLRVTDLEAAGGAEP